MLLYLVSFLVIFSFIVIIHEYGHYYFAKKAGAKVEQFFIFGLPFFNLNKEFFGWNDKDGTRWSIGYVPIGGYVKTFGAEDYHLSQQEIDEKYSKEDQNFIMNNKKYFQKVLYALGGPLANFLSAILVFSLLFIFIGKDVTPFSINEVVKDSPAEKAGLMVGDKILSIEGNKVENIQDVSKYIRTSTGKNIEIIIQRYSENKKILVQPNEVFDQDNLIKKRTKKRVIGIVISYSTDEMVKEQFGPIEAIMLAIKEVYFVCKQILIFIGQLLTGRADISQLSGPVGIAKMTGEAAKLGFLTFITFFAYISISLGFMNLLPIPLLDGGLIVLFTIEKIIGAKIKKEYLEIYGRIGLTFIMFLTVFALYSDLFI